MNAIANHIQEGGRATTPTTHEDQGITAGAQTGPIMTAMLFIGDSNDRNMFYIACGKAHTPHIPHTDSMFCLPSRRNQRLMIAYQRIFGIREQPVDRLAFVVRAFVRHVRRYRGGVDGPIIVSVGSLMHDIERWWIYEYLGLRSIANVTDWLTRVSKLNGGDPTTFEEHRHDAFIPQPSAAFKRAWQDHTALAVRKMAEAAAGEATLVWRTLPYAESRPYSDCTYGASANSLRRIHNLQSLVDEFNELGRGIAAEIGIPVWDLAKFALRSMGALPITPTNLTMKEGKSVTKPSLGLGQGKMGTFNPMVINEDWQRTWVTTANCIEDQHLQPLLYKSIYYLLVEQLQSCGVPPNVIGSGAVASSEVSWLKQAERAVEEERTTNALFNRTVLERFCIPPTDVAPPRRWPCDSLSCAGLVREVV